MSIHLFWLSAHGDACVAVLDCALERREPAASGSAEECNGVGHGGRGRNIHGVVGGVDIVCWMEVHENKEQSSVDVKVVNAWNCLFDLVLGPHLQDEVASALYMNIAVSYRRFTRCCFAPRETRLARPTSAHWDRLLPGRFANSSGGTEVPVKVNV